MNELSSHQETLYHLIGQQLQDSDFDLVDVVYQSDLQQYSVQVKARSYSSTLPPPPPVSAVSQHAPREEQQEGVYLADGTLNTSYLFKNAELLAGCGEYALAKNIYLKIAQAGQSSTNASRALFSLGTCCEAEHNLDEARSRYEQSITFQPMLETYQRLANLLIHQKKDRPAAEALERALNLKDLPSRTRFEILKAAGNCWMRAGEMAAAERAYKKALENDPSADEIQANLGVLYLQAGKTPEARRKFQDTVASNPRNDKAIAGLGMCYLDEGDKREAHDHFARALEINLNNSQAIYQLVKCAYELKTYATAARIVENYIQVSPVNINLLYSLAGLQFHLGRMGDAQATAEQITQMNPQHTGAKDLLQRIESFSCHGGQDHNGN